MRTSNSTGVKQGRCSPTSLPFSQTLVPYVALWIFSLADVGHGPVERERAAIPEGLAVLAALGRADLGKGRLGHVGQARHGHLVIERLRLIRQRALGDLPGPVERNDRPRRLGRARRANADRHDECETHRENRRYLSHGNALLLDRGKPPF